MEIVLIGRSGEGPAALRRLRIAGRQNMRLRNSAPPNRRGS
jgi:hypothetical protein